MPELDRLLAFAGAGLVLLLSPGPAVLFVVTRSIEMGSAPPTSSTSESGPSARETPRSRSSSPPAPRGAGSSSRDFVGKVFNPKPSLFFLAFLPQFVSPERGAVAVQLLVLGLIFVALAIVTDGGYALVAGSIRRSLVRNPRVWRAQRLFSGSVYVGLGAWAALAARRAS